MLIRCFSPGLSSPLALVLFLTTCATAAEAQKQPAEEPGWFAFEPKPDPFTESAIDLRFLNERFAGEKGFIGVQGDHFVHTRTGAAVRFWAVNGPPTDLSGEALRQCARRLAKYAVNLVRTE